MSPSFWLMTVCLSVKREHYVSDIVSRVGLSTLNAISQLNPTCTVTHVYTVSSNNNVCRKENCSRKSCKIIAFVYLFLMGSTCLQCKQRVICSVLICLLLWLVFETTKDHVLGMWRYCPTNIYFCFYFPDGSAWRTLGVLRLRLKVSFMNCSWMRRECRPVQAQVIIPGPSDPIILGYWNVIETIWPKSKGRAAALIHRRRRSLMHRVSHSHSFLPYSFVKLVDVWSIKWADWWVQVLRSGFVWGQLIDQCC